MLERLQRLAGALVPWRTLYGLLALGALAALSFLLISGSGHDQDRWLLPLAMVLVWGLSLEALVQCFSRVPGRPDPAAGWWRRAIGACRRGLASLGAAFFLLVLVANLWLSLKALSLLLSG